MPEPELVSVVIPTHQRREALRRALHSLAEQTAAGPYEVVVSIDGSTDGSAEMVADLELPYELRTAVGPGRGRAAACNAAIELARGEILVVLDDDMRAAPQLVARHRTHHPPGSRRCVMGAVPIELEPSSPRAAHYVQAKFDDHLARLAEPGHEFVPRDFYSGNASLRAETMREVGGFSESYEVYGNEDVDLSLRLRALGVELGYDAAAAATQEYDKDLRALCHDTEHKGQTTVLLAAAHPEALPLLRLSQPWDGSRPWLAARALLLAASRHIGKLPDAAFAIAAALERLGAWRAPLFYRPVLDLAFWAGVDGQLRESPAEGELRRLAEELRRGPIDLLLHR